MRSSIRFAALLTSMIVTGTLSLAGCATFSKKEPDVRTATLQRIQADYQQAKLDTEAMSESLEELTVATDLDLAQAFDAVAANVDRMQEAGKMLVVHGDEMNSRGASYIVESEQTATACYFPRMQAPQGQSQSELGTYFDAISAGSWEVKQAYRAYQFDIRQIKSHLMHNVTRLSVDSIAMIFEKAKVDGDSLLYALDQVQAAIERAKIAKAANPKQSR